PATGGRHTGGTTLSAFSPQSGIGPGSVGIRGSLGRDGRKLKSWVNLCRLVFQLLNPCWRKNLAFPSVRIFVAWSLVLIVKASPSHGITRCRLIGRRWKSPRTRTRSRKQPLVSSGTTIVCQLVGNELYHA